MRKNLLASMRALPAAMVVVLLAVTPADSQAPKTVAVKTAKDKPWTPPRTPWGDPDLRGIFANNEISRRDGTR